MSINPYDTIINKLLEEQNITSKLYLNAITDIEKGYYRGEIFAYDKAIKIIKETVFQR